MEKNGRYWSQEFIMEFSMQIQEAIQEAKNNSKEVKEYD